MKTNTLLWMALFILISISACNQKGTHQPLETTTGTPQGAASASDAASFSSVKSVLESRCVRCHNSGTNDWRVEANIQRVANSGSLNQRLTATGGLAMPQPGSPEASSITQSEKNLLLQYIAGLSASTSAGNSVSSNEPGTPTNPNIVTDPVLVMVGKCTSCHGVSGNSIASAFPNLAGHNSQYIQSQLEKFLTDSKKDSPMHSVLKQFATDFKLAYNIKDDSTVESSEEMKNAFSLIAQYFSNQNISPSPNEFLAKQQELPQDIKNLFDRGYALVNAKNCTSCHLSSPSQQPLTSMPMIFGQKKEYLEKRLLLFKDGKEGQTMPALMIGFQLTEDDIKAISTYLSLEHPILYKAK